MPTFNICLPWNVFKQLISGHLLSSVHKWHRINNHLAADPPRNCCVPSCQRSSKRSHGYCSQGRSLPLNRQKEIEHLWIEKVLIDYQLQIHSFYFRDFFFYPFMPPSSPTHLHVISVTYKWTLLPPLSCTLEHNPFNGYYGLIHKWLSISLKTCFLGGIITCLFLKL